MLEEIVLVKSSRTWKRKFDCKIEMVNASFEDNPNQLADLLRAIAEHVDGMGTERTAGLLVDDNGNSVGKWEIR